MGQSTVAQWEQGAATPRNDHVFKLEWALRLAPGMLARHLGFGPPVDGPAKCLPGWSRPSVQTAASPIRPGDC